MIPNGLKVFVEPSIGNRDDDFLQKWHDRLETFSKTLTSDVIEYCEQVIAKTDEEIKEKTARLKDQVSTTVFADISNTITTNVISSFSALIQK